VPACHESVIPGSGVPLTSRSMTES
jgi:hypothetical protein